VREREGERRRRWRMVEREVPPLPLSPPLWADDAAYSVFTLLKREREIILAEIMVNIAPDLLKSEKKGVSEGEGVKREREETKALIRACTSCEGPSNSSSSSIPLSSPLGPSSPKILLATVNALGFSSTSLSLSLSLSLSASLSLSLSLSSSLSRTSPSLSTHTC
jgi:hypothetical protein